MNKKTWTPDEDMYEGSEQEPQDTQNIMINNIVMLTGEITPEKTNEVMAYILSANYPDEGVAKPEVINFIINSPGGCMSSTFALISIMMASNVPIRTIATGVCASGGLMLAIAGTERYVDKYCQLMSHTLSTGSQNYQKPSDLQRWLDSVHMSKQMIVDLYAECTGLTDSKIVEHLLPKDGDVYLTAKQAIGFNMFEDYFTSFDQLV